MIQRLQSLWLLLAAACMALAFKFKFAAGIKVENAANLSKDINASSSLMTLIFALAFIGIALFSIFLYKNTKKQKLLVIGNVLIGIATIYFLYDDATRLSNITYAISAVLPVFALGFNISAIRGILNDQKTMEELNSSRLRN